MRLYKVTGRAFTYFLSDGNRLRQDAEAALKGELEVGSGVDFGASDIQEVEPGHVPPKKWRGSLVWGEAEDGDVTIEKAVLDYTKDV